MFAAIWNSIIMVCNTWSFEEVANLKLTGVKIMSIAWSEDDNKIIAYGHNGTVSVWNITTRAKEHEVYKISSEIGEDMYTCVALSRDARTFYAGTNVGTIDVYDAYQDPF
jgi:WD40 repeat protein